MNHKPSQLRLAASAAHALGWALAAVGALRAMSVMRSVRLVGFISPRRASPPPGGGRSPRSCAAGGGDSGASFAAQDMLRCCHPTPDHLRWSDPPPSGEGEVCYR